VEKSIKKASLEDVGVASPLGNDESRPCLMTRLRELMSALHHFAAHRGYKHWIITFLGGKDSTTTLVIALETAINHPDLVERIDVVYSDKGIEIPVIQQYALDFLEHLRCSQQVAKLPLHCHIVYPAMDECFWVCLLGKGYPPPHQRFRWCTRRLKIEPVEKTLKTFIQSDKSVVLTGVRFGESRSRDGKLNYLCSRGGECGQGIWFHYSSRLGVGYLAPIAHWRKCDVCDFLNFHAPSFGYPTQYLEINVYNGRETRFGCWMCTVVKQDKTMEKIIFIPQWAHLCPLLEFRQRVRDVSSSPNSRILRPDGTPGRLKLSVRRHLLDELMELQTQLGIDIISPKEIEVIKELC
jgi:DNA sulfur modification protein DndC